MDPEKARDSRLRRLFGITAEEYDTLLAYQNNSCAICLRPPKNIRLAVDHSHASGLVRGLVCTQSNKLLAYARDNPDILLAAYEYLTNPPAVTVFGEKYGVKGSIRKRKRRRKTPKVLTVVT